ncbi:MAG: response regulator [Firmicutes bacterium]|nr:response regulator [Bacillota bacterium]
MGSGKNVLIVDDMLISRILVKKVLDRLGFPVVGEAANGNEALSLYRLLQPDLVIMDLSMPEMGGMSAIKEIIKMDPDAYIIVYTAMDQHDIVVSAIQAGARDYIVKPVKTERIISALTRAADRPGRRPLV